MAAFRLGLYYEYRVKKDIVRVSETWRPEMKWLSDVPCACRSCNGVRRYLVTYICVALLCCNKNKLIKRLLKTEFNHVLLKLTKTRSRRYSYNPHTCVYRPHPIRWGNQTHIMLFTHLLFLSVLFCNSTRGMCTCCCGLLLFTAN